MKNMYEIARMITGFVGIVIGVMLVNPLQTAVTEANVTGMAGTLLSVVTLIFVIAIIMFGVSIMAIRKVD